MPKKKGCEKTGGRKPNTPNKKTEQWLIFSEYVLNGGLEKFEQELSKLQGKDFINAFTTLLEYHKPKLARTELTGKEGKDLIPERSLSTYTTEELLQRAKAMNKLCNDK